MRKNHFTNYIDTKSNNVSSDSEDVAINPKLFQHFFCENLSISKCPQNLTFHIFHINLREWNESKLPIFIKIWTIPLQLFLHMLIQA